MGERKTGYFHASTRSRRIINKISVFDSEEEVPLYEEEQILEVITAFFHTLFSLQLGDRETIVAEAIDYTIST